MAINKHSQSFCEKDTTQCLQDIDCSLYLKAIEEASRIIQSFPGHFLFTPSDNGYINEKPVNCPILTQVFKKIITEGHSIVFSLTAIDFMDFINELFSNKNISIELLLSKYKIQTIPSNSTNYILSGGSFAQVYLNLNNFRWRVSKLIKGNFGDIDADIRLIDEGIFISNLPSNVAKYFPRVSQKDVLKIPPVIGYHMEYFPYPTIAEQIFSGDLSPERAVFYLKNIYQAMLENVYSVEKSKTEDHDDYLQRIDRRMQRILDTPDNIRYKT
ncbi:hypothetical protein J7J83_02645 [bacterium]|nr:hypothetical protein [bacterium]